MTPNSRTAAWRVWLNTTPNDSTTERTAFGRWFAEISRNSVLSAEMQARAISAMCKKGKLGRTPMEILERARSDPKRFSDMVSDHIDDELGRGIQASSLRTTVAFLEAWLRFDGLALARRPKFPGANVTTTLTNECALPAADVRRALSLATPRGKVVVSLMRFCGVRPEVLGNHKGTDGLKLGDIADLRLDAEPRFDVLPARVNVRAPLSKTRQPYMTFLAHEGAEHLLAFLKMRQAEGERLTRDSPAVPNLNDEVSHRRHVTTGQISTEVKNAFNAAGIEARPYILRVGFSTAMFAAESRHKLPHSLAQHMMGHKGDMTALYSINKGRLPVEIVEEARKAYDLASRDFLATSGASLDDGQAKRVAELEARFAAQERELAEVRRGEDAVLERMADRNEALDRLEDAILERLAARVLTAPRKTDA